MKEGLSVRGKSSRFPFVLPGHQVDLFIGMYGEVILHHKSSGERGIRTPGARKGTLHFECSAFNQALPSLRKN